LRTGHYQARPSKKMDGPPPRNRRTSRFSGTRNMRRPRAPRSTLETRSWSVATSQQSSRCRVRRICRSYSPRFSLRPCIFRSGPHLSLFFCFLWHWGRFTNAPAVSSPRSQCTRPSTESTRCSFCWRRSGNISKHPSNLPPWHFQRSAF